MIINTGMRTDIPAFYSEWLLNRIREEYVMTRNPYDPSSVTRYSLSPDVVDVMAFCTKNPAPMLGHMDILRPYGQYWFVTITPYGKEIEPNVPDKSDVMRSFRELSRTVGRGCVGWRYDPIFITDKYSLEFHKEAFERMAAELEGYTETCVISFIDMYAKVRRNFPEAREVQPYERAEIGKVFAETGRRHGITVRGCAEGQDLARYGVDCSGCMTVETYEKALGVRLNAPKSSGKPRKTCNCLLGNDIGAYDTCLHLCRYCYANTDAGAVRRNRRLHDPTSPLLIGHLKDTDTVHDARQESWTDGQLTLG